MTVTNNTFELLLVINVLIFSNELIFFISRSFISFIR